MHKEYNVEEKLNILGALEEREKRIEAERCRGKIEYRI
jgi:hypothetical protein